MTTVVVGAGLIGLATAYSLQNAGEKVVVLEAERHIGYGSSFANAGMLTPSLPEPWNGPGLRRQLLTALFNRNAPVRIAWKSLPGLAGWGLEFLRNSGLQSYLESTRANYQLAKYSLAQTLKATDEHGLEFNLERNGTLCLYENKADWLARSRLCNFLESEGLVSERVSPQQIGELEPALLPVADRYVGGIRLPDDARGDGYRFCKELAVVIEKHGGEIRTGCRVLELSRQNGAVDGVLTADGSLPADRVVVAGGAASRSLLRSCGIDLPIRPAKGYSLTFDIDTAGRTPAATVIDDAAHSAVGRFGSRLRVTGFAEFAGFDRSIRPGRTKRCLQVCNEYCPMLQNVLP